MTMVRMVSSGPVGVMMNQNSMFTMLTIHTACSKSAMVDSPSRATHPVQVQPIAEHELPEPDVLLLPAPEGARKREAEGRGEEERRPNPINAYPVILRARDAALGRIGYRYNWCTKMRNYGRNGTRTGAPL